MAVAKEPTVLQDGCDMDLETTETDKLPLCFPNCLPLREVLRPLSRTILPSHGSQWLLKGNST